MTEKSPETETPRRSGVNWALVAWYMARGFSMRETAEKVGCSRTSIWRAMKASDRLREQILRERKDFEAESGARLRGLAERAVRTIEAHLNQGNLRAAVWVAKELGVVKADYALGKVTPEEWAEIVPAAPAPAAGEPAPQAAANGSPATEDQAAAAA